MDRQTTERGSMKSNNTKEQRSKLLERLRIKPGSTIEARHELDIIAPAPRIFELRHKYGHNIQKFWVNDLNPGGKNTVSLITYCYLVNMEKNKMEFANHNSHPIQLVVRATTKLSRNYYNKKSNWHKCNDSSLPNPIDYYSKHLSRFKPREGWTTTLCPFHQEKNPSFAVHTQKGCFICFSCGAKGKSIIGFHAKKYGLSFDAARKALEGK